LQQPLKLLSAVAGGVALSIEYKIHVACVLALREQDFKHAAAVWFHRGPAKTEHQELPYLAERIRLFGIGRCQDQHLHRQHDAVCHRDKQFDLVAKVPINRAAREARPHRDVFKRPAGNAMLGEDPLGRVENPVARFQRLLPCSFHLSLRRCMANRARHIRRAESR